MKYNTMLTPYHTVPVN